MLSRRASRRNNCRNIYEDKKKRDKNQQTTTEIRHLWTKNNNGMSWSRKKELSLWFLPSFFWDRAGKISTCCTWKARVVLTSRWSKTRLSHPAKTIALGSIEIQKKLKTKKKHLDIFRSLHIIDPQYFAKKNPYTDFHFSALFNGRGLKHTDAIEYATPGILSFEEPLKQVNHPYNDKYTETKHVDEIVTKPKKIGCNYRHCKVLCAALLEYHPPCTWEMRATLCPGWEKQIRKILFHLYGNDGWFFSKIHSFNTNVLFAPAGCFLPAHEAFASVQTHINPAWAKKKWKITKISF